MAAKSKYCRSVVGPRIKQQSVAGRLKKNMNISSIVEFDWHLPVSQVHSCWVWEPYGKRKHTAWIKRIFWC